MLLFYLQISSAPRAEACSESTSGGTISFPPRSFSSDASADLNGSEPDITIVP